MQELLKVFPLYGNTKGINIYNVAIVAIVDAYKDFEKCACIVADGSRAMIGNKNGLLGILKDCGVHCPAFHCIIYKEALCTKLLSISDVMISVTNVVNIIEGGNRAQRHSKIHPFFERRGGPIQRCTFLLFYFSLQKEMLHFLHNKTKGTASIER